MLTKIGVAALLGTIGTAAVGGGVAKADEPCRNDVAQVSIAAPVARVAWTNDGDGGYGHGGYGRPGVYYRHDRREELERMRREQREEAMRRAMWMHRYARHGYWR